MKNHLVPIREATAKQFLPEGMHKNGGIDLRELADAASSALVGSQKSLDDARQIVDGNWLTRLWNSNELQSHVIDSIGFLRDISKVNLGLSAICNDLAQANLEHARRIDSHTQSINDQLATVQAATSQILDHLCKPKSPALLDSLIPTLTDGSLKDREAVAGWLKRLTENINLEYEITRERLDKCQALIEPSASSLSRLEKSMSNLTEQVSTDRNDAEATRSIFKNEIVRIDQESQTRFTSLVKDVADNQSNAEQRAQKQDGMLKAFYEQLADGLKTLNSRMTTHQSEFQSALKEEADIRSALNLSLLKQIAKRDETLRRTISALNIHWLKRLILVGSVLAAVQVGMFIFFAFKTKVF